MMSAVDLTVAVTAHAETVVAGPTMRSAERAIRTAEARGFRVERLLALDRPSRGTRAYFSQPSLAEWAVAEYDFGDQGAVRNVMAEAASGRWIAFLDADDLFSENWLAAAAASLASAADRSERVVAHPELRWLFDRTTSILTSTEQEDPLFTPYYFYFANYYDALCMAPREAHADFPYASREISNGFAYEDWQWAIETMAKGWRHVVVPDTIIFKRRREVSQTIRASQRGSLYRGVEPMAIDKVAHLSGDRRRALATRPAATAGAYVDSPNDAESSEPSPSSMAMHATQERHHRRPALQFLIWLAKGRPRLITRYLRLRRSPRFDPSYYLAANEDVRNSQLDPLAHYVMHGAREGRSARAAVEGRSTVTHPARVLPTASTAP